MATQQARGYKSAMTIDFESAFGVSPTTKKGISLPMNSNELSKAQTLIESDTITNTRNDTQPALGRVSVDGDIEMPADYSASGYMLKALFGDPKTTGTAPNKTHVFTVKDNQPSIVVEKAFPDLGKYVRYKGVKINTFSVDFGQDNEMTFKFGVMGASREQDGTPYDAAAKAAKLQRIAQNHAYVKIDGTESRIVKEGSLEISANLDGDQYVVGGGGVRGDIPEGLMKVSGSLKALFVSTDWMDKADTGAAVAMEIGFKLDENTSLVFAMPTIQFEPFDAQISGPAGVVVEVKWRAFSADGKSIVTATLRNQQEAY